MSLAWRHVASVTSVAQVQKAKGVWPDWTPEQGAPPIYSWYVSLELCDDLHESIFSLHSIPKEEPYIGIVMSWAMLRREAKSMANEMVEAARALREDAKRRAGGR